MTLLEKLWKGKCEPCLVFVRRLIVFIVLSVKLKSAKKRFLLNLYTVLYWRGPPVASFTCSKFFDICLMGTKRVECKQCEEFEMIVGNLVTFELGKTKKILIFTNFYNLEKNNRTTVIQTRLNIICDLLLISEVLCSVLSGLLFRDKSHQNQFFWSFFNSAVPKMVYFYLTS